MFDFVLHGYGEFESVAADAGKVSIEQSAVWDWQCEYGCVADDGAVVLRRSGQGELRKFTGPQNAACYAIKTVLMILIEAFDHDDAELAELWEIFEGLKTGGETGVIDDECGAVVNASCDHRNKLFEIGDADFADVTQTVDENCTRLQLVDVA